MLTPTISKITVASHVFSHAGACMQIQESMKGGGGVQYVLSRGSRARSRGMLQKKFEILMPRGSFEVWCNLRLDARLETIINNHMAFLGLDS